MVPVEVRNLISEFIPTQDLGDDLHIDSYIIQKCKSLNINLVAVIREKEEQIKEIKRIEEENVIPTIMKHCKNCFLDMADSYEITATVDNKEEFIEEMAKVGWNIKESVSMPTVYFMNAINDSKLYQKLHDDLITWTRYKGTHINIESCSLN